MFALLLLLLLVVPFVELWVIVEVWRTIGGPETLLVLVAISVVGAWMVKREGLGVWVRLNAQLAQGRLPTDEIIDGALVVLAGALLLTPGFVTDGVGLILLVPPSRAGLRALARRQVRRRVEQGGGAFRVVSTQVITGRATTDRVGFVDVDGTVVEQPSESRHGTGPGGQLRSGQLRSGQVR